ncbi:MAG: N-acetylglucosamine-6-phosphate deacetylase [Myxococcales bacterium]|nr:N-acetylglucosamine-6-phosphate deacetylase [Myxococcales bacterium]
MNPKFLHNLVILDPEVATSRRGGVLVENGKIAAVFGEQDPAPESAERVDLEGFALAPGLLDLHFHGELIFAAPAEVPAALERTAEALLGMGTTGFLATTVAWNDARIEQWITQSREFMTQTRQSGAQLLGVHLEGPWINPAAAGALPGESIRPFDPKKDDLFLDSARDVLKMVTFAPECHGGLELLAALRGREIVASLGHSLASQNILDACVKSEMTHVTHLFNAMGPIHHREPGLAGWALAEDRVSCDLICDGVHVHPAMVRTACRAKGEQLMLITDRIQPPAAADLDSVSFGSGPVHDDGDAIRLADGGLAGSNLSLDRAVRNVQAYGAMNRIEAIAAATLRPARLLGIESQRGTLRPGARADFAIFDAEDNVHETWIAGERVFARR